MLYKGRAKRSTRKELTPYKEEEPNALQGGDNAIQEEANAQEGRSQRYKPKEDDILIGKK